MNSMQLLGEAQFHGAKRLAFSNYRSYWALALTVLLCCSLCVLSVAVNRYFENPTYVMQVESEQTLKPFPTVVVCPEVDFPQHKIDAFVKNLKYPPEINASYILQILPQLGALFSTDMNYVVEDLAKIQHVLEYNDLDIETAGRQLTSSCQETIVRCRWLNEFLNCSTAFRLELTSYGFCCIFNGRSLKREIRKYGVHSMRPVRNLFVHSIGFTNSLMIAVNQSYKPLGNLDLSYKWLIIQGAQYTDIVSGGVPISPAEETWIGYASKVHQVSEDTKNLGDELRHCKLTNDPLKYFPHYHKRYCLLECEMARVQRHCNCAQLVHPYEAELPVCGAKHITCVRQAAVTFSNDNCRCPPSCDTEIESILVANNQLYHNSHELDEFYKNLDFNDVSIVRVYILRHNRQIYSRHSYVNAYLLFSQLGGIFNVFFGCSVLSLVELVQLALRFIRDFYYQRQTVKEKLTLEKDVNTEYKP